MRYLLFGKDEFYYASGGAHDLKGAGKDLERLITIANKLAQTYIIEWWHIYDTIDGCIVAGSRAQAHGAEDLDIDITAVY